MQILERLIRLSSAKALPIPFTHRIPLGLMDDTKVHVGLAPSPSDVDRISDVVVSVLDLDKYNKGEIVRVRVRATDRTGLIRSALKAVSELNVALAEAVTTDEKNIHDITLICELKDDAKPPVGGMDAVRDRIVSILASDNISHYVDPPTAVRVHRTPPILVKEKAHRIDGGYLNGLPYREWIETDPSCRPIVDRFDLRYAAISADTEQRLLRYRFPKKNSRTLSVGHEDQPGALLEIFEILSQAKINVLSSYLRRGGEERGRAKLVAICEPPDPPRDLPANEAMTHAEEEFKRVTEQLQRQDLKKIYKIDLGRPPRRSVVDHALIYPRPPKKPNNPPILLAHGSLTLLENDIVKSIGKLVRDQVGRPIRERDPSSFGGCIGCIYLIGPPTASDPYMKLRVLHRLGSLRAEARPIFVAAAHGTPDSLKDFLKSENIALYVMPLNPFDKSPESQEFLGELRDWVSTTIATNGRR